MMRPEGPSSHDTGNEDRKNYSTKQNDDDDYFDDDESGHEYRSRQRNNKSNNPSQFDDKSYTSGRSMPVFDNVSHYSKKSHTTNSKYRHVNHDEQEEDDDESEVGLHQRLNNSRRSRGNHHYNDDSNSAGGGSNYYRNNESGLSDDDLDGVEDHGNSQTQNQHNPNLHQNDPRHVTTTKKRCCAACCPSWKDIKTYCSNCTAPKWEFRGICACPHGRCYGIMGILTAQGGLMMNLYVLGTCRFNRIKMINPVTGEPIPGSERSYGFDARETNYGQKPDYHQCTYYPDDEKDEIWDSWMGAAKFFSYSSAILGVIGFIILFSICCMAYSKSMFERWLFWGYIAAAITVSFSFLVFGSEFCQANQCKVADGCGWALSCFFFHLMAANTVKNFPEAKPPKPPKNDDDDEDDKANDGPTIDDVYDELYYDDEADKYPPPLPDGRRRGIIYNDQGEPEFDPGEDYFDDFGNFIDPYQDYKPQQDGRRANRNNDDEDDDEDDEDGSEYTDGSYESNDESDYDSEKEDYDTWRKRQDDKKAGKYDPTQTKGNNLDETDSGNFIRPEDREFPLHGENDGNLGVGYEHLDENESKASERTNQTGGGGGKKKVLYGAPPRPNMVSDYDDDHIIT